MKKRKGINQHQIKETTVQELLDSHHESDAPRAIVSHELLQHFERFYEYHPAQRLSRNLRSLLLEFLMYDGSAGAEYLRDLVIDLDGLFTLLDAMAEEGEKPTALASRPIDNL